MLESALFGSLRIPADLCKFLLDFFLIQIVKQDLIRSQLHNLHILNEADSPGVF